MVAVFRVGVGVDGWSLVSHPHPHPEDLADDREETNAAIVLVFAIITFLVDWNGDSLLPKGWYLLHAPDGSEDCLKLTEQDVSPGLDEFGSDLVHSQCLAVS